MLELILVLKLYLMNNHIIERVNNKQNDDIIYQRIDFIAVKTLLSSVYK
jgi:hypothetical protein